MFSFVWRVIACDQKEKEASQAISSHSATRVTCLCNNLSIPSPFRPYYVHPEWLAEKGPVALA